MTITDESGRVSSDTVTFEINQDNNVTPVAHAGGPYATGPINANQMTPINLDARASYDPDQPVITLSHISGILLAMGYMVMKIQMVQGSDKAVIIQET